MLNGLCAIKYCLLIEPKSRMSGSKLKNIYLSSHMGWLLWMEDQEEPAGMFGLGYRQCVLLVLDMSGCEETQKQKQDSGGIKIAIRIRSTSVSPKKTRRKMQGRGSSWLPGRNLHDAHLI